MRSIILHTGLFPFSSNGSSSMTAAGKTAALDALKDGIITKPDSRAFDGVHYSYNNQTTTNLIGHSGPNIVYFQGEGTALAIFKSDSTKPENLVMMSSYDTLKFTKIHLMAGGTAYSTADVDDITVDYGDDISFTHSIYAATYSYGSNQAAFEIASALRSGYCEEITSMKYTLSTTGSMLYTANNFSWDGYIAKGETDTIVSGYPNNLQLFNTSNVSYASLTPYTGQALVDGAKYKFEFTIGTNP